ncbi:GIY-YIG nuclease family protein [Spongiimicrobium salis]|uniref:GIY-YIG nuclease family protein n=1 Tax=Spongiimicrobium salis TaxID=1667022 RepID=UPI00374D795E
MYPYLVKSYYVYLLKCSDGLIYTGFTNNIVRRLKEHEAGGHKNSFTYTRRPVSLIFCQEFNDVHQAIVFEKKIKKWGAKKKLTLARGDFDMLRILSECRNASHSDFKPTFDSD